MMKTTAVALVALLALLLIFGCTEKVSSPATGSLKISFDAKSNESYLFEGRTISLLIFDSNQNLLIDPGLDFNKDTIIDNLPAGKYTISPRGTGTGSCKLVPIDQSSDPSPFSKAPDIPFEIIAGQVTSISVKCFGQGYYG